MTDRELLEYAAKAAGIRGEWCSIGYILRTDLPRGPDGGCEVFDPLTDDGDALRLAVTLGICIEPYPLYSEQKHSVITKQRRRSDQMREANPTECIEVYNSDPAAATRRAITGAAAEIGKATL